MKQAVKLLWNEHKLLLSGFVLAIAVMLFFAVRSIMFWVYWADPAHREQPIADWMTPRYVAHSWDVPPQVIGNALGLSPETGRITIGELANARNMTTTEITRQIEAAIQEFRANPRKPLP